MIIRTALEDLVLSTPTHAALVLSGNTRKAREAHARLTLPRVSRKAHTPPKARAQAGLHLVVVSAAVVECAAQVAAA